MEPNEMIAVISWFQFLYAVSFLYKKFIKICYTVLNTAMLIKSYEMGCVSRKYVNRTFKINSNISNVSVFMEDIFSPYCSCRMTPTWRTEMAMALLEIVSRPRKSAQFEATLNTLQHWLRRISSLKVTQRVWQSYSDDWHNSDGSS
jgi:hypothetical protein